MLVTRLPIRFNLTKENTMTLELMNIDLSGGSLPKGAKTGQFCADHISTAENQKGTDCATHIDESIGIYKCPFTSIEEAMRVKDGGKTCADGACRDARLRGHGVDRDYFIGSGEIFGKSFEIRVGKSVVEGVLAISPPYLLPGLDTLEAIAERTTVLRAARKNAGSPNESYEVGFESKDPETILDLARTVFDIMQQNRCIEASLNEQIFNLESENGTSELF